MNVVTCDAEKIAGVADVDRHMRRHGGEHRLETSARRLTDEQRPHAVAAILDDAPHDEPPFGDKQPTRSDEVGIRHVPIRRHPRVVCAANMLEGHDPLDSIATTMPSSSSWSKR